jgi:hypothetical protein
MFGSSSSHVGAVIIKLGAALRDLAPMRRVGGWAAFDAPPPPYRSNSDVDVLSGPIDDDDDDNDVFDESSSGALLTAEVLAGVGGAGASPPRKSSSFSSTASTSASQRRSSFLLGDASFIAEEVEVTEVGLWGDEDGPSLRAMGGAAALQQQSGQQQQRQGSGTSATSGGDSSVSSVGPPKDRWVSDEEADAVEASAADARAALERARAGTTDASSESDENDGERLGPPRDGGPL